MARPAARPAAPPVATAPGRTPRAGRDLPMAIAVGLGLGVIIVGTLLFFRPGFVAVIALAVGAAVVELRTTLHRARGITLAWVPVGLGVIAAVALSWPFGPPAQVVSLSLTALAVLVWRLPGGAAGYLTDVAASVFVAVYLGVFASFAALLAAPADGAHRVLIFLICVVASDTGGYAAGVLGGRHPMAPTISPKKSWEGFGGSVAAAMLGGALCSRLMFGHPVWQGLLLGAVLAVVATVGDLAESLIKRDLGVKDMGNLLPGHGGIMDRLDSLLPSAVVSWLLLTVLIPLP